MREIERNGESGKPRANGYGDNTALTRKQAKEALRKKMLRIIRFIIDFVKEVFTPGFRAYMLIMALLLGVLALLSQSHLLDHYHQEKAKERAEKEEKIRQEFARLRREIPELDEYLMHQERCESAIRAWLDEYQQATPEAQKRMSLKTPEAVKRACRDAAADDAEEAK